MSALSNNLTIQAGMLNSTCKAIVSIKTTTTEFLRDKEDKLRCFRQMPKLTDAKRDTHQSFYGSFVLSVMEGVGKYVSMWM